MMSSLCTIPPRPARGSAALLSYQPGNGEMSTSKLTSPSGGSVPIPPLNHLKGGGSSAHMNDSYERSGRAEPTGRGGKFTEGAVAIRAMRTATSCRSPHGGPDLQAGGGP